jgi:DNA-binding CsgD family transcriptional regulator
MLSRIADGELVAERLHVRAGDGRIGEPPLPLAYPLLECEILRRRQGRLVKDADPTQPRRFAAGFALVFERAVLRRRLRGQRREIARIATWAEVRSGELRDGRIDLAVEPAEERDGESPHDRLGDDQLVAELTARELDVLRLMAEGKTNGEIARTLVVTEGTVKFHVKNVLRKLQASNRADAAARLLRLTLGETPARSVAAGGRSS